MIETCAGSVSGTTLRAVNLAPAEASRSIVGVKPCADAIRTQRIDRDQEDIVARERRVPREAVHAARATSSETTARRDMAEPLLG